MTASSAPGRDRLGLAAPWLLLLCVLTLHGASVTFDYTLDDYQAVLGHPAVVGEAPLWQVWTREFWGEELGTTWSSSYRPVTSMLLGIEHRISASPGLHHLVNVLCFAALCEMIRRIALRSGSPRAALIAALAFAALPIHVENVASIVGRADVLAAIGALASVALLMPPRSMGADHVQGSTPTSASPNAPPLSTRATAPQTDPPTVSACLAAAACFLAGLLCKETVILTPLLLGWFGVVSWRQRELSRASNHDPSAAAAPIVALPFVGRMRALHRELRGAWVIGFVALGYMIVRTRILPAQLPENFTGADNLMVAQRGAERIPGVLSVLGHYAELVLVPLRLCPDHTYADILPATSMVGQDAMYAWLGVLIVVWACLDGYAALVGRSRGMYFAAALSYLLVGHLLIDLSVLVAERLMLWPTVWLVLALACNAPPAPHAADPPPQVSRSLGPMLAACGLLALLGARTMQRTFDWRDDWSLQQRAVLDCPRAVHSRFIMANLARERGETQLAIWHYAVAGAGRAAFPGAFESPLLEEELERPSPTPHELDQRIARLPELVGAKDPMAYWAAMHRFLLSQGAFAEARLIEELAVREPPP